MLSHSYMQLALGVGLIVGLLAPVMGFFLVERRMSLVGDAIGHAAFAGVAAGLLFEVSPVWMALVVAIAGAALADALRGRGGVAGDQSLALLLYTGMALAIVLAGMKRAINANLFSYLFGSILTVSRADVASIAGLALAVAVVLAATYRPLLAMAFDEEGARASGLPVRRLSLLMAVLAAITITAAMRAVGLLLVAALMVLPVMAATAIAWSVRSTILLAMAIGAGCVVIGLAAAYVFDLAPSGTTVLAATTCVLLARLVRR